MERAGDWRLETAAPSVELAAAVLVAVEVEVALAVSNLLSSCYPIQSGSNKLELDLGQASHQQAPLHHLMRVRQRSAQRLVVP